MTVLEAFKWLVPCNLKANIKVTLEALSETSRRRKFCWFIFSRTLEGSRAGKEINGKRVVDVFAVWH